MSHDTHPALECAENIAIASLFQEVPLPPTSNIANISSESHYALSFDQERQIAGTLAFLAHIRENSNYVPAVCIEEDQTRGILHVIFAVNKARVSDGNDVLRHAQQGFDEIFTLLAQVSTGDTLRAKNQIFYVVVSMCSSRILSRLRLAPSGRGKAKRSFKDSLQELTIALAQVDQSKLNDRNLSEAIDSLIKRAKEARKHIDSWSRHQVIERLLELVESIHQIKRIERFQYIIDTIPNTYMDPSARQSFINTVDKVSRYREAARFLYRMAKKVPLARKMQAVPVHLPKDAFITPSINTYTPDLLKKVTEASPKGRQQKLLKEICCRLGLSEEEAKDRFCRQVMNTLTQAKIHAEVQIIAYCESQSQSVLPRVICSSKDACFLCNMFLRVYGKIHTPRSHGRLYPGWRLPSLPQFQEVERRFCQSLQNNFLETCTSLLSGRRQTLHPYPIESTLFTLPVSDSTLLVTTSTEGGDLKYVRLPPHEAASFCLEQNRAPYSGTSNLTKRDRQAIESVNKSISVSDLSAPCMKQAICGPETSPFILQGSGISGKIGPSETSESYFAGPLEIIIEIAGSRSYSYHIEWLSEEEADKMRGVDFVIDIEAVNEITLDGYNPLYVTSRGALLRLSWTSKIC